MIIRKSDVRRGGADSATWLYYSDGGSLTQFGAYVETLQPGAGSSDRHWHSSQDEFLYVLSGEATVIEDSGASVLRVGDAACWPAGVANAHSVEQSLGPPPAST